MPQTLKMLFLKKKKKSSITALKPAASPHAWHSAPKNTPQNTPEALLITVDRLRYGEINSVLTAYAL